MTYQRDTFDPNLNNIHAAMDYNSAGQPVLRVIGYGGSGGTMDLTAFHVETLPAADSGALTYDNTTGVFLFTPYSLATASTSILGGVKVDGSTISINNGVISAPYTYTLPKATANALGGVEIGTNISIDSDGKISVSFAGLATETYVTNSIHNNLNLGNFVVNGTDLQTLSGTVNGADIVLEPLNGSVRVPALKIGTQGTVLNTTLNIEAYITTYELVSIVASSTGPSDALVSGVYGNINGVTAPWTVFELAPGVSGTAISAVAINDILTGIGIVPSTVRDRGLAGPGDPAEWNNYVIVGLDLAGLGQVLPLPGAVFNLTRPLDKANLNIQSATGTDIFLDSQGLGDVIVNTNILPVTNNISNLGSPTKRWKSIYLGPGTVYVFDETLGKDISIGARDGLLYVQNGAGLSVGEFTLIDNQILIVNPARDIIIGQTDATADVVFNRSIRVKDSLGRTALYTDRMGRTQFYPPSIGTGDVGAVSIIGSTDGSYQSLTNAGGMLHITGRENQSARVTVDAFGTNGQSNTVQIIGRSARGTAATPLPLVANDVMNRIAAAGWQAPDPVKYARPGVLVPTAIEMVATEAYSEGVAGSRIDFYTAPNGTDTKTRGVSVDSTGLLFTDTNNTNGITFFNGDRLTYFPTPVSQTNKWLKSNGTTMSWQSLPVSENPVVYKGSWNADTNASPIIISTNGNVNGSAPTQGWEYSISATGTIDIGAGSQLYSAGGFIIWSGTSWSYIPPVVGMASIKFDGGITQSGVVSVVSSDIISTLNTGSIANTKLANSSVSVTAGSGMSGGGTVSLGNSITITNAGVTAISTLSGLSTNTNATGSVTITNTGVISVESGGHITATTVAGAVTLGSDATSSDTNNTIALRDTVGGINAKDFTATSDASIPSNHGPFNYGTLSYSDTGIMADFSYNVNNYNQVVLQNRKTGDTASTNFIVSNNQGTASAYYGEFGMNSSIFSGTGSLALPNAVYLNSVSSDLVLGGAAIHFVIGTGTDAVSINSSGVATFANTISGSITGNSATANRVNHTVTFAAIGGAAAGTTFDGSATKIVDYSTVGAQVAGTYVTSVSGTSGRITSTGGTTPALDLASGIVTTGTYGGVTSVPVITVDTYGRITNITTVNNPLGTVTSISTGTNNVSGITLSGGTITSSGTISLGGSISGLTNSNLSGTANISNTNLANSTISGVSLGGSLFNLTAGTNITFSSGTTYNGSTAITINAANNGVGGNQLVYELNGSLNLTSAKNTLVSMFGLTSGVALQSNTRYQYEIVFTLSSNKAGAISYALALSGGAVVAQHNFQWMANKTNTIDGYGAGIAMASFNATGAAITAAKDIAAFDNFTHVVIYGNIDVTTAGNVNFMLSQDQPTPITWTMLPGAYIKLLPLGAIGANTVAGTWA